MERAARLGDGASWEGLALLLLVVGGIWVTWKLALWVSAKMRVKDSPKE